LPVRDADGDRANAGAYVKGKRVGGRADGHPYPAPVSTFAARGASPFGVANLSGNVREWTATDAGPGGRTAIVLGGGWKSLGHELRLSRREVVKPEDFAADLGLRCVRDEKK
jgi:formylglycine-generating enzyme required for sulfatase activity